MLKIGINNLLKFNYLKNISQKTVTNVIIASTMLSAVVPTLARNNEHSEEIKKNNIENINIEKPIVYSEDGTVYVIQYNPDLMYYTKSEINSPKRGANLVALN